MKKRSWLRKLIYFLIILAIVILIILFVKQNSAKKTEDSLSLLAGESGSEVEQITKTAEVIPFGQWQPNNYRKILGTVKSSSDTDVLSNLSGKIAKVFVDIGDKVYQGEVLAKFSRENDVSQISYENALNSLENAKFSAENSVRSSKIALENAQNDLAQTKISTKQNYSQSFTILYTQAKNAETNISNSIKWTDRLLDATRNYEPDPRSSRVGRNNSILKNNTKNLIQEITRETKNSRDLAEYEKNETTILTFSQEKNQQLKKVQKIIRNLDKLIRGTTTSRSFLETAKIQLQQEVEGIAAKIDGNIVSLESQIEASKSSKEQINTAILSAENRVKNAKANLELAKSNAENQVSGVRNQVNLASKSIRDFEVKAPFAGKISAKFVSDFNQVNPGQKLFSIVALDSVPEIIAYLTAEETRLLANPENIKLSLPNGETAEITNASASGRLDEVSQKMEVKFRAASRSAGGISDDLLVGSIVNVLLPVNSDESNLIPISAISFEPDGAEVFVVNLNPLNPPCQGEACRTMEKEKNNNKTNKNVNSPLTRGARGVENPAKFSYKVERRKVQTGKIVSNAVEVLGGLKAGENVIQYRNRVNAGDLVEIKN